jgi:aspartyl-tRNA(Asn)/glutamyl-tRNA(Gln) amidotransferase subunit B
VQRGLEYEQARQADLLARGERVVQQTLRWDEATGATLAMRSKEDAHDYRYFPDPDLPRFALSAAYIAARRQEIPELPAKRRERFEREYGLPAYDAGVLTASRGLAEFFEQPAQRVRDPKTASNWIMGELLAHLKAAALEIAEIQVTPFALAELISLIEDETISAKIAKTLLKDMLDSGKDAKTLIAEQGLVQISDEGELREIALRVLAANSKSVDDYRAGKEKALGALIGQVMKETRGKANPQIVNRVIVQLISDKG